MSVRSKLLMSLEPFPCNLWAQTENRWTLREDRLKIPTLICTLGLRQSYLVHQARRKLLLIKILYAITKIWLNFKAFLPQSTRTRLELKFWRCLTIIMSKSNCRDWTSQNSHKYTEMNLASRLPNQIYWTKMKSNRLVYWKGLRVRLLEAHKTKDKTPARVAATIKTCLALRTWKRWHPRAIVTLQEWLGMRRRSCRVFSADSIHLCSALKPWIRRWKKTKEEQKNWTLAMMKIKNRN